MRQFAGSVVGVLCLIVAGCGSNGSGGPNSPSGPGGSLTVGPMRVRTAEASGPSPVALGGGEISLTALWGATITGLTEIGPGRIAFVEGTLQKRLCVMQADGSRLKAVSVSAPSEVVSHVSWSPDGGRLAVAWKASRFATEWDLLVYALGSGSTSALWTGQTDLSHPAWSPDGTMILCSARRGSQLDLGFATPPELGGTHSWFALTNNVDESYPSWSPDGRYVLYARTRATGLYDLFLRSRDGTHQVPLTQHADTNDLSNRIEPAMSPDGRHIAYTRLFPDAKGQPDAYGRIYVMNADGSHPVCLSEDAPGLDADDRHPTWSSDGRKIAFSKRIGNGPSGIWVMNPDGSDPHMLTNGSGGGGDAEPDWCRALSVKRVLVGPADNPDEQNPPFGPATPLVVCALGPDGLVAATAIDMEEADWPTLDVSPVQGLVAMKIQGEGIHALLEDAGWGREARWWQVPSAPPSGGYMVVFSQITGRAASVIVVNSPTEVVGSVGNAERAGGRVVLRGAFSALYAAGDPTRNHLTSPAHELVLEARNGEVLTVK